MEVVAKKNMRKKGERERTNIEGKNLRGRLVLLKEIFILHGNDERRINFEITK